MEIRIEKKNGPGAEETLEDLQDDILSSMSCVCQRGGSEEPERRSPGRGALAGPQWSADTKGFTRGPDHQYPTGGAAGDTRRHLETVVNC